MMSPPEETTVGVPELTVQQALERAARLAQSPTRVMLGIAGPPGAGKSTVAARVLEAVKPAQRATKRDGGAVVIGMDGFHLSQAVLERRGDASRKGAISTFDADGYVNLLRRIRAGEPRPVWAPEFDREIEDSVAGAVAVHPHTRVVVTEGNYLLADAEPWVHVRDLLDEVWYLDVPEGTRLRRLVDRHVHYGRTPQEAHDRATTGTDALNAALVEGTRHRADVVVKLS